MDIESGLDINRGFSWILKKSQFREQFKNFVWLFCSLQQQYLENLTMDFITNCYSIQFPHIFIEKIMISIERLGIKEQLTRFYFLICFTKSWFAKMHHKFFIHQIHIVNVATMHFFQCKKVDNSCIYKAYLIIQQFIMHFCESTFCEAYQNIKSRQLLFYFQPLK